MIFDLSMEYKNILDKFQTEEAIKTVKDIFQEELSTALHLHRMTAPLFVQSGLGLNDDLNGEQPVSFQIRDMGGQKAEIVHSLAKWKRIMLGQYNIPAGEGIYTDMSAIRTEEHLDELHSLYVDQWDWEATISAQQRNLDYLKETVQKIYRSIKNTERRLCVQYKGLEPYLPEAIYFISSERLRMLYPFLSAKERENEICKQYGAVFIIGIGGKLGDGSVHDSRAADYDDWSSEVGRIDGQPVYGLNGDLLIWYPILNRAVELSSMGIRVDANALLEQLTQMNMLKKKELYYHSRVLNNQLPLSIGGGIGQSRLCMVLLHKAHVGEVQASIWPEQMREECKTKGIELI